MAPLFHLLGPIRLDGRLGSVIPATHLRRGLLAVLASRPNNTISLESIIDALWAAPTASARSNLRTQLSGLRRDFEAAIPGLSGRITVIRGQRGGFGGGVALAASEDEIDLLWASELLESARGHLRPGREDFAVVANRCHRALAYFNGDPGIDLPTTIWFDEHNDRIRGLRRSLTETLAEARRHMEMAKAGAGA